jgi:tRNA threonylcarbamoyladenosine biosynthesis protein TsaB
MKSLSPSSKKRMLAWDTSSKTGVLVAIEWEDQSRIKPGEDKFKVVCEWSLNLDAAQHSEKLLWAIDQMLTACGWRIESLSSIGIGIGPGSFTGLRIGISTARTLAHYLNIPIVPLSSLALLARPLAHHYQNQKVMIIASSDAAKGELFTLYGLSKSILDCLCLKDDSGQAGIWKRGVEEDLLTPDDLIKTLHKKLTKDTRWIAIGESVRRYPKLFAALPPQSRIELSQSELYSPQGRVLGSMAWEGFQAGLLRSAAQIKPRYVRASDAEVKLAKGLLAPAGRRGQGSR